MARRFEHANERWRVAAVEIAVPAYRVIAHLVDVVVGVKQPEEFDVGGNGRLHG
jgi:hypothetical protein